MKMKYICLMAMFACVLSPLGAEMVTNSFFIASGTGVAADGECAIVVTCDGPTTVTITPRPGWKGPSGTSNPFTVTVSPGVTTTFALKAKNDEGDATGKAKGEGGGGGTGGGGTGGGEKTDDGPTEPPTDDPPTEPQPEKPPTEQPTEPPTDEPPTEPPPDEPPTEPPTDDDKPKEEESDDKEEDEKPEEEESGETTHNPPTVAISVDAPAAAAIPSPDKTATVHVKLSVEDVSQAEHQDTDKNGNSNGQAKKFSPSEYAWTVSGAASGTQTTEDASVTWDLQLKKGKWSLAFSVVGRAKCPECGEIVESAPSTKTVEVIVCTLDFEAKSDRLRSYDNVDGGKLIDSRTATIIVNSDPAGADLSSLGLSFKVGPVEKGGLVNDGHGTKISVTRSNPDASEWKASTVYWYGVLPDRECAKYEFEYAFTLRAGSQNMCSKNYKVVWPEKNATACWNPPTNNCSTVSDALPWPATSPKFWYCQIQFKDFEKDIGLIASDPFEPQGSEMFTWSGQYFEKIKEEEEFHLKQFRGDVSFGEGGAVDCFIIDGIKYFLAEQAKKNRRIVTTTWIVKGKTADGAKIAAENALRTAIQKEIETSKDLIERNRGFHEMKAKERVNYNAAYRYHCSYESDYGSNPKHHSHPGFNEGKPK